MKRGCVITLTDPQFEGCKLLAKLRCEASDKLGLKDRHGAELEDSLSINILGACGEMALARHLNVFFDFTVNTFKAPDVNGWQVRTRSKEGYDLIIRDDDKDYEKFVLVVGTPPVMRVVGWIGGKDGKQRQWRKDYGGRGAAYFVPQYALNSI